MTLRWRIGDGPWQPSECPGPWLPLYVGDLDGGTSGMTLEAFAIYVRLLCHEWEHGPLPDDERRLASIVRASPRQFTRAWPEVEAKFAKAELNADHALTRRRSVLVHMRLESERSEALELREKKQDAGRKGAKTRWSDNGRAIGPGNTFATDTAMHPAIEDTVKCDGKTMHSSQFTVHRKSIIPVPSEQARVPVAPAAPSGQQASASLVNEQPGAANCNAALGAAARTSDETHQEALQREMGWSTPAQGSEESGSRAVGPPRGRRKRVKVAGEEATAWPIAQIEILLVQRCPGRVSLIRDGRPPYARVMQLGLQQEAWEVLADWLAAGGEAWPAVKGALVTWSMLAAKGTDLLAAARAWAANGRGVPVPQVSRSRGAVRQHHMTAEQLADMKRLF